MLSDFLMGVMKLAIAGLFIWGLHEQAERSIELDRATAEEEGRRQDLRLLRQDILERQRIAESLVRQAHLILALRLAGEPASDHEAAVMRTVDGLAVGLAAGLHCEARRSLREILTDAGDRPGDLPKGDCEQNTGFNVIDDNRTWPHAWTEELDGMRRSVERKLSDLDQELVRTDVTVGRLSLMANGYIVIGAVLAICMLVMQTAVDLFASGGNERAGPRRATGAGWRPEGPLPGSSGDRVGPTSVRPTDAGHQASLTGGDRRATVLDRGAGRARPASS